MRKLTKTELRGVQTLTQTLMESGIEFETAAEIVGIRLKYLDAFPIPDVARVFRITP